MVATDRIIWFLKENMAAQNIYRALGSIFLQIVGFFVPVKDNRILFTSYNGGKYNDSPRAIYEYMRENHPSLNLEYVWSFRDPEKHSLPGCKIIKSDTLSYFLTALSSKYWVTNVNIERGLCFKKKNTVYLNTYHGIAIKKDGKAAGHAYADYSGVDILCADGAFHKMHLMKDYGAKERNVLMCGRPREDTLREYRGEDRDDLKKLLGLPLDKKVILYAPTWRESRDAYIKPPIDFEKWRELLGDEYVVLYRAHHYARNADGVLFNDFIIDGTKEEDINVEYKVSDLLISDYSGVFGDYSILERPMLCFAYDYEQYKACRGFNIDPNSIFKTIYSTEEALLAHLVAGDFDEDRECAVRFKRTYMECGGQATRACVDALLSYIKAGDHV